MSHLETHQLTFGFKQKKLFQNFSISFANGLTMISGANGTGKSTLLRLFAGLLKPQAGTVSLDGKDLKTVSFKKRAQKIGWLPQQGNVLLPWSVFDYVMMGRYPRMEMLSDLSKHQEITLSLLKKFELLDYADRSFSSLSGGEQQLARICRVLVQETDILLLDEPFGALDLRHRLAVWNYLGSSNRTILVVSHDLSLLDQQCQRLVLLSKQGLVADGIPRSVLTLKALQETFQVGEQFPVPPFLKIE